MHSFRSKDQVSTISVDNKCKPYQDLTLYFAINFSKKMKFFLKKCFAYFIARTATRVAEK